MLYSKLTPDDERLTEIAWDSRETEDMKDDQNDVFCVWERIYIESSDWSLANEETWE
jgi:hypothetical protein